MLAFFFSFLFSFGREMITEYGREGEGERGREVERLKERSNQEHPISLHRRVRRFLRL